MEGYALKYDVQVGYPNKVNFLAQAEMLKD